jgi:hypothetical protein
MIIELLSKTFPTIMHGLISFKKLLQRCSIMEAKQLLFIVAVLP